jgi:hypothetical protein
MVAAWRPPPSVRAVLLGVCVAVTLSSCAMASSPVGQPGQPQKGPIEVDCNSPLATGLQAKGWTVTPNNNDQGRCNATPPEPEGSR